MGGLLYNDFVAVGGKKLIGSMAFLTILFCSLRLACADPDVVSMFFMQAGFGESINLLDTFFMIVLVFWIGGMIGFLNYWTVKIVEKDQKNRARTYICSLPIEKNTYIASKYVFIAVSTCVYMLLAYIWTTVFGALCSTQQCSDIIAYIRAFLPSIMGISLSMAAMELPMLLFMGKEKTFLVKTAILLVIAYICCGFFFFADLSRLQTPLVLDVFLNWYEKHPLGMRLLRFGLPVILLGIYYLSYRMTCRLASVKHRRGSR